MVGWSNISTSDKTDARNGADTPHGKKRFSTGVGFNPHFMFDIYCPRGARTRETSGLDSRAGDARSDSRSCPSSPHYIEHAAGQAQQQGQGQLWWIVFSSTVACRTDRGCTGGAMLQGDARAAHPRFAAEPASSDPDRHRSCSRGRCSTAEEQAARLVRSHDAGRRPFFSPLDRCALPRFERRSPSRQADVRHCGVQGPPATVPGRGALDTLSNGGVRRSPQPLLRRGLDQQPRPAAPR